jgi:hypothetical protein
MALSWGNLVNWLLARRRVVASFFMDTTEHQRQRWVAMQARRTGSHDCGTKFHVPYRAYAGDIYAVPGNHDWSDELTGFMMHICDRPFDPRPAKNGPLMRAIPFLSVYDIFCPVGGR